MDTNLIAKYKPSEAQMSLNKIDRIDNLENTFCLNKKANYKSAVIIDDVVTTGSTAYAIAMLLRKTNINNISLWAVARRC
jgi:predicted amidophosphoribosyltransferase